MIDIMSLLNPQSIAQQQAGAPQVPAAPTSEAQAPGLADQWNAYLSDPNTKAALLSAGLAMMRPTWGGPGQALVSGIGAGMETLGDRQTMQMKVEREDAERASSKADKAMDRASALEIAKMNNDSRMAIAQQRGGIGGKGMPALYQKLMKEEYDKLVLANSSAGFLNEGVDLQDLAVQAETHARDRWDRSNAFLAGQGTPGGAPARAPGGSAPPQGTPGPNSQMNSPVERKAKNTATGEIETLVLKDGKWVKK